LRRCTPCLHGGTRMACRAYRRRHCTVPVWRSSCVSARAQGSAGSGASGLRLLRCWRILDTTHVRMSTPRSTVHTPGRACSEWLLGWRHLIVACIDLRYCCRYGGSAADHGGVPRGRWRASCGTASCTPSFLGCSAGRPAHSPAGSLGSQSAHVAVAYRSYQGGLLLKGDVC
jgi:hypothetical protein